MRERTTPRASRNPSLRANNGAAAVPNRSGRRPSRRGDSPPLHGDRTLRVGDAASAVAAVLRHRLQCGRVPQVHGDVAFDIDPLKPASALGDHMAMQANGHRRLAAQHVVDDQVHDRRRSLADVAGGSLPRAVEGLYPHSRDEQLADMVPAVRRADGAWILLCDEGVGVFDHKFHLQAHLYRIGIAETLNQVLEAIGEGVEGQRMFLAEAAVADHRALRALRTIIVE
mmetsp:Transcript_52633/g.153422  ORF Transcript_52633/g.153422 Transcript_52633/m.153422 type:complete len:227 (-) Transcript_52633:291-971(-)